MTGSMICVVQYPTHRAILQVQHVSLSPLLYDSQKGKMQEELCVISITLPEEKSNELACQLEGKDSKKAKIQRIFLIVSHEYLKQVLRNKGTCRTKNTCSKPIKVTGRSDSESTTYDNILFIGICPV